MPDSKDKKNLIVELNDYLERTVDRLIPARMLLVFFSSALTVVLAFLLAFYFRFDFSFPAKEATSLPKVMLLALTVKLIVFFVFRLYGGMWRYVSITDLIKIFFANILSSVILVGAVLSLREQLFPGFAWSVLVIDFLLCFMIMSGKRVAMRIVREAAAKATGSSTIRTILVGTPNNANNLIQTLASTPGKREIIGIMCNEEKTGRTIRGVTVLGTPHSTAKCAKKHQASEILLLPPYSKPGTIKQIIDNLDMREHKCTLRMVPEYADIADGKINVSHIKEVEIEDLLGRKPINMDRTDVVEFVKGKNILVTGAGGSIGTELCLQLASYKPATLTLFELSEFNLYEIARRLESDFPDIKLVNFIGDVRSKENINRAIADNRIDIVYHAAAYKHVPLMEQNPSMSFTTNVLGTATVAESCEQHGVKRMVVISTDKAVKPTSIMGSTKRIAERVILERTEKNTEFVVVRFGNVLGSSGSVIPLFKQQIKNGGPVTVTSKNVIRYFMSIPEAVDLVLQAGTIGNDRDIMVLEMGEQVRIYDMAKRLIELSGLEPEKDITIEIVGLRPGEKEYEELLTDEETVDRTPFDKIYVARKDKTELPQVDLKAVSEMTATHDIEALIEFIHTHIPENKFHTARQANLL